MVTVKCKRSRGFPFDTFSFQIDKNGHPKMVNDLYEIIDNNNIDATRVPISDKGNS